MRPYLVLAAVILMAAATFRNNTPAIAVTAAVLTFRS